MILPTLSAAGMEVMVARMATKLARRGHDVGVSCIERGGPLVAELTSAGVRVSELAASGLFGNDWLGRIRRHLDSVAPDVLHVHSGGWLKGALAGRSSRVPCVLYTAHGFVDPEPWHERVMNRVALPLTDHVVAVSEHLGRHLSGHGVPHAKLTVIANGIDPEMFQPRTATSAGVLRQRLGIPAERLVIGTVARLVPIKNQAMLIDAVAAARQQGVDCAAVLIGEGPLKDDLQAQAASCGIADRVHFWGLEADVARLYPELDLFSLTSNLEGTSISLLEAMASGVCPIVTAVGGNPAAVGDAGVLVAAQRPDQMAAAIVELAANAERRRSLGATARQRVEAHFSDDAMITAYEKLYAQQHRKRA